MVDTSILIGVGLGAITAAIFCYLGSIAGKMAVPVEHRFAQTMFSVWWWGIGATTGIGALNTLLGSQGLVGLAYFLVASYFLIALILVALLGLLYYMMTRFLARPIPMAPLVLLYVGVFAFFVWFIQTSHPDGLQVNPWNITIHYAAPKTGLATLVAVLLLIGPQLVAGIGYFFLASRTPDRGERARIRMVAGAIVVWFGVGTIASAAGVTQLDWYQLLSRFLSLSAAAVSLAAYRPPGFLREMWGLTPPPQASS